MGQIGKIVGRMVLASALLPVGAVWAGGGMEGGGGKGVLCHDRLRTLDLYEAEAVHHYTLSHRFADLDSNLKFYGSAVIAYLSQRPMDPKDPSIQDRILAGAKAEVIARFKDVPAGTTLEPTQDATLPPLPSGCKVVQVAVYSDVEQVIYRDPVLWARLDALDQAALILHEAIYKAARNQHARTSDDTRQLIGRAMSDQALDPMFKPIWNAPRTLICVAGIDSGPNAADVFELYAVDEVRQGKAGVGIYFDIFKGSIAMAQTWSFVAGISLERIMSDGFEGFRAFVSRDFYNDTRLFEIGPYLPSSQTGPQIKSIRMRAWASPAPLPVASEGFCQIGRP